MKPIRHYGAGMVLLLFCVSSLAVAQFYIRAAFAGRRADLKHAILWHASLSHANLEGADLSSANLQGADLSFANLKGADFTCANLTSANLSYTDLTNAKIIAAKLLHTNLNHCRMVRALLRTDCLYSNLKNADLSEVSASNKVQCFVWTGLDLEGANLKGAQLDVLLDNANLSNADLRGVDLSDCVLIGGEFRNIDNGGTDTLHNTILTGAMFNRSTKWPTGFDPIKHKAIEKN